MVPNATDCFVHGVSLKIVSHPSVLNESSAHTNLSAYRNPLQKLTASALQS